MDKYTTHYFKTTSDYTVSVGFDWRLGSFDVLGSIAHARMLSAQKIISEEESSSIIDGLKIIHAEIMNGSFEWREDLEDVHMNIENRLFELIGEPAGRLHTGRSRNDQVATATRLYLRDAIDKIADGVTKFQLTLLDIAGKYIDTIMPGYTHLQRAQPILFAHHLMAYFEMISRDYLRLMDCRERVNILPLGSGALAGVPYPLDREMVADELKFQGISNNSIDAISSRDYIVEFHSFAAIMLMHLSRFAEDLILWSSTEFGYIKFGEEWVTGSSIMPQKRNPDFAELARGKTGRVYGNLLNILVVTKGLPLSYNTDLQEDKEALFDSVETVAKTLDVFNGMLESMTIDKERMLFAASDPYMLATDLADYLVNKGVTFRRAHESVSSLCERARSSGVSLMEMPLEVYKEFNKSFEDDVYQVTPQSSIDAKDVAGGTSQKRVSNALKAAKRVLANRR